LWIDEGSPKLSAQARAILDDPYANLFLSVISVWEILIKNAAGKLPLKASPESLIPLYSRKYHLTSLPLDEKSTLCLNRLPRLHRDPFDRMLICQAIVHGLTILTPDPLIKKYPVISEW
jgi:PIN domain nuclease of toxin-antitoxin system